MAEQPLNDSTEDNQPASGSNTEVGGISVCGNVSGNIVAGNNNTVNNTIINMPPEQQAFRSLHQLPQPPADFTGRDELIAQLLADFAKGKGAAITSQPIHGLIGMGGIGKTALGLVVAHQVAKDYPDAQIFLDLKGTTEPLSTMDVMRHVILSFEPAMDVRTLDEASMSAIYRSVLHKKKVLLFLDNAKSAEQIAPLRPSEACALLVTSRWAFSVPGLHSRRVDVMSEENAEKFLLELCPRIGEKVSELAKACVYLPLALRIAGSLLQVNHDWSIDKYLSQLNDRKQRLATLHDSREDAELTTEPDLLATFELSYHRLSEENRIRWRMLGVFPASFDTSAVAAMWDLKESAVRKVLGLLLRYSLLDYDETSSRYNLHDLLADFSLIKMEKEEEIIARVSHSGYYSEVLESINKMYLQGGENILLCLRLYDAEWMNIEAGQRNSVLYLEEKLEAAQACNRYAWQGSINGLRLKPIYQIKWIENGISASRVLRNRKAEAAHLSNLGSAYHSLGETRKAIEFYERRLAIAREIGDRVGEGNMLGNLGLAYKDLGEVRKAINFYDQCLAIARETGNRRGEEAALGNLGTAYSGLGDASKAIDFYEQCLAIAREIGDRLGEGTVLGDLGNAYAALSETHKAVEFYEEHLAIAREIGDRRGEGRVLGNLGSAYNRLGETHKAIEFYEQRITIAREIGDRRGEGHALLNMGSTLYSLEEKDRAIPLVRQALEIYEAIESPNAEKARKKLKEWGAL